MVLKSCIAGPCMAGVQGLGCFIFLDIKIKFKMISDFILRVYFNVVKLKNT
jgi:hypothetical protein